VSPSNCASPPEPQGKRILFVISVGLIAVPVLRDQVTHLTANGHEVHVTAAPDEELELVIKDRGGSFEPWDVQRSVGGLSTELRAVRALASIIKSVKPDIIVAGTPKAGLLGVALGRLLRVQRVIYTLHGLRLEGASGIARLAMLLLELLACRLATEVHVVGADLRDKARSLRLLGQESGKVVGCGSASGIDIRRFHPATPEETTALRAREELTDGPVVGFVGRITHDKGLTELNDLAAELEQRVPTAQLVLVGEPDYSHPGDRDLLARLRQRTNVRFLGRRSQMELVFPAFDVLALPSWREGLPTVALEAASCAVPTCIYSCTGARDAVIDGVTGVIVPKGQSRAFSAAVLDLLDRPDTLARLGHHGRLRVEDAFDSTHFLPQLASFYLGDQQGSSVRAEQ
jgi:glycosyltransferase involved in cell wall biosynthesis